MFEAGRLRLLGKKSQQNNKKRNQLGRSMIEMLGVLAIVGVLSAGGIAGYSMAMQSYKTNLLMERVNLIANRARTIYKNSDFTGISSSVLINAGKLSAEDFKQPFGGDISIAKSTWGSNTFHIRLGSVPADTCTDMLSNDWGDIGVFEGVHIRTDADRSLRYNDGTWPISTTDAVTYCKGGTSFFDIVFK